MNFIPVPLSAVKGDLRRPHEHPVSDSVVLLEMGALIVLGEWDEWSQSQLAKRFRCGKARLLKCAQKLADQFQTMSGPATDQWRTALLDKFPHLTDTPGPEADRKRTGSGPRARSSLKREERREENAAHAAEVSEHKSASDKTQQTKAATQTTIRLRTLIRSIKGEQDNKRKPSLELIGLVSGRLDQGYTEEDLGWLVRWACLATDEAARWFQQEQGGKFANLDTLLRRGSQKGGAVDKLEKSRIPAAEAWRKAHCPIGGRWASNADEATLAAQGKPVETFGGIPADDMVAVVLDIARQLREGTRPLAVSWPRWLDVLDDRRVRLTAHVMQRPADVATIDDPSKAASLLEAA
jgi:hypothetical protein